MAQFIHLTDERLIKRLKKSGIRTTKWNTRLRCVYATPVLKDFQVSHQWLREPKNRGIRTIGAVQFRISGPRRIEPMEITRSYVPTQIIGWRYHPDAHGKPPFCGCDYCQRGRIKNRKIRDRYKARNQKA